jgi:hypothetical protein
VKNLLGDNNSFEEYRKMKGKLFENLKTLPEKKWKGKILEKTSVMSRRRTQRTP